MSENIAQSIAYTVACIVILNILAMTTLFTGTPDYMDALICSKLGATPRQCAVLIELDGAKDKATSTTTTTTSVTAERKGSVE